MTTLLDSTGSAHTVVKLRKQQQYLPFCFLKLVHCFLGRAFWRTLDSQVGTRRQGRTTFYGMVIGVGYQSTKNRGCSVEEGEI